MTLHVFNTSPTSIAVDSRQVRQGSLFLAYPGEKADGRQYIQDAIQNGAVAVLWEPDGFDWNAAWSVENLAAGHGAGHGRQAAALHARHSRTRLRPLPQRP